MQVTCVSLKGRTTLLMLISGFVELSVRFLKEKHIQWKTPLELFTQFLNGSSIVIYDGSKIVGHFTLWPLAGGWQEAGSIWVRPEYRGRGIAKQLFGELLSEHATEKILLTTTNPVIMRLGAAHGLTLISFADLPVEVHRDTCVCSSQKMKAACYLNCRLKDKACKLFIN